MNRSRGWASATLALSCIFIQSTVNAADYGRLKDPNDPNETSKSHMRCGDVPLPQKECEELRQEGVSIGCITQDESNKLKEWGMAPVCLKKVYRGWCSCGCLHPVTLIGIEGLIPQARSQDVAQNPQNYALKHLGQNTSLSALSMESSQILYSTSGAEARPLVVIETQDGRTLKLTTQHAVMTAQGEMIQAQKLTPETLLLDQSGSLVSIQSLKTEPFSGAVVNFRLDVKTPIEHVIFAEGLAVGDQAWQSTLEDLQNQVLVRQ